MWLGTPPRRQLRERYRGIEYRRCVIMARAAIARKNGQKFFVSFFQKRNTSLLGGLQSGKAEARTHMDAVSLDVNRMIGREQIRDCIARLARGEDRRDAGLISACHWPDSTSDYGVWAGNFDEYLAWVVPGSPAIPVTQHVLGQSVIDLADGTARVETHVTTYHRVITGEGARDTVIGGRYLDLLENRDGDWRIIKRVMLYDWLQDFGLSVDWAKGVMGMKFSADIYTGRATADYSETFFAAAPHWSKVQ
jgi:hypothetical protein